MRKSWLIFGPCTAAPGQRGGRSHDVDEQCDGTFRTNVQFAGIGRRFKPIVQASHQLQLGGLLLCDVEHPEEVTGTLTAIPGRLPAGRVFGEQEYVILRARDTFRETFADGGSATTTVSWTLRMRRAR